jgi:hypothetical protein
MAVCIRHVTSHLEQELYYPLLETAGHLIEDVRILLSDGEMFVLEEHGRAVSAVIVTTEADSSCDLRILATVDSSKRCAYERTLATFIVARYSHACTVMTMRSSGLPPHTRQLLESLGFRPEQK